MACLFLARACSSPRDGTAACRRQRPLDHARQPAGDALPIIHQLADGVAELPRGLRVHAQNARHHDRRDALGRGQHEEHHGNPSPKIELGRVERRPGGDGELPATFPLGALIQAGAHGRTAQRARAQAAECGQNRPSPQMAFSRKSRAWRSVGIFFQTSRTDFSSVMIERPRFGGTQTMADSFEKEATTLWRGIGLREASRLSVLNSPAFSRG